MARLAYAMPCIPGIPTLRTWLSGNELIPSRVVMTGICAVSASSRQFVVGPGDYDSVSGEYDRAPGLVDEVGGAANHPAVAPDGGLVAGQVYIVRPLDVHLFGEYVLGDVHQDGAGAAGVGDVERLVNHVRYLGGVHYQVVVLGDGQRDARDVGFL